MGGRARVLLAVLVAAGLSAGAACGGGGSGRDAGNDAGQDAGNDAGHDVPATPDAPDTHGNVDPGAGDDGSADPDPDAADTAVDNPDVAADLQPDVPDVPDLPPDTVPDVAPDAPDVAPDTPDVAADVSPDIPDIPAVDPYGPAGTPLPVVGFGEGTVGGLQPGHDTFVVTSLADDGPGTLREALRTNGAARLVTFDVDGTIEAASPFLVPSNITLDGRGRDVAIRGKGLVLPGSDQVIVTNLALVDVGPDSEDGVQIGSALPDPSEFVVLDHVRFTQHGDGGSAKNVDEAVSVVFGSRNITLAWCRFESWEKVLLAGNGDADPALDARITITVHHTYAQATGRRHPQARHGRYHLFNDFWDDWRMYGSLLSSVGYESFGSQVQDGGRMLLEGQMVRRHPHEYDLFSQADHASRCESGGDIQEHGTWTDPASTADLQFGVGCAGNESFEPPYDYAVETAGPALRDRVVAGAGNTLR